MKPFPLIALCLATFLAGCESLSTRVEERFTPVPPHTRTFAVAEKTVYDAGQQAVKRVGLLLGHSSLAHGTIEGYAPIRTGDASSDSRQTTIEIKLTDTGAEGTQVDVLVWDHTEGHFPGGVSEQAFREHSLYEAYFAALQEVLAEGGAVKTEAKP